MPKDTRLERPAVTDGTILYIRSVGGFAIKYHGDRFGKRGIPDIPAIYRSVPLWIETKRPVGGKISDAQLEWIRRINAAGGLAYVANSVDITKQVITTIDVALDNGWTVQQLLGAWRVAGFPQEHSDPTTLVIV